MHRPMRLGGARSYMAAAPGAARGSGRGIGVRRAQGHAAALSCPPSGCGRRARARLSVFEDGTGYAKARVQRGGPRFGERFAAPCLVGGNGQRAGEALQGSLRLSKRGRGEQHASVSVEAARISAARGLGHVAGM
eukprot:365469-Chlamydomonas_euryale.AAC.28